MIQVKARKMGLQVLQDSMNKVGLLHIDVMIVYSYRAVESEERSLLLLAICQYPTLEESLSFWREV